MLYTSNINKYDYERKDYEMNKENAQDNVDNIVYDLNSLYSAFLAAKKDSDWKPQVQKYGIDFLPNIVSTKDLLKNREYHSKPSSEFIINERGKVRPITGLQMSDRVIRHSLCDNVLSPSLIDYLIYDNGASLKGKGIDFSRKRFEEHLHKYYRMYGNDGYILLMDYSKFYDNIPHDIAYREIAKQIQEGKYQNEVQEIHHTLEGSAGNLCLNRIKDKFDRRFSSWDMVSVLAIEEQLLKP